MKLLTTSMFLMALLALPAMAGDEGKACEGKKAAAAKECTEYTDCEECEDCADCTDCGAKATLTARIADLEASAAKGCEKSAKMLATLCEACGAKDTAALKLAVAECEKGCAAGCEKSGATIAKLEKAMGTAPARLPLSAYVAKLSVGCEKGCEISKKQMASLSSSCGTDCAATMASKIKRLEIAAFLGSATSAREIAALDKALGREPVAMPALSVRIRNLVSCKEMGCPLSGPIQAKLTEGRESACCQALATDVVALETKAADGCEKCKGEIAALETKLDAVVLAAIAQFESDNPGVLTGKGAQKAAKETSKECPKEKGACPSGGAQ